MRLAPVLFAALSAAGLGALCACSNAPSGNIGLIDAQRIQANWPKFLNYQNQLAEDAQTIERSKQPEREKARERAQLQQKYVQAQTELTDDVMNAAAKVASDKHLAYVLTRQYVGYGGVDITPDVEKVLQIVEKPSPSP
jgi:Skp family chaperone for outer membrane proteins